MLMAVQGPYTLMVQPDEDVFDPRRDGDNFGTMVCFHRRHSLGDDHKYEDKDDFLRDLYLRAVGNDEQGERKYDRLCDRISEQPGTPYGSYEYARAIDNALLDEIGQKFVVLPLYLYDHSGLTMNTTGFSCPWDSGQVGWIYVSREDALTELGGTRLTAEKREQAENLLRGEVNTYDLYLRGECYGYELYKHDNLEDSCWGFLGSIDVACKDIAEYLPDDCKDMVNHLAEQDTSPSMIKTLLRHARIQIEQAAKAHEHTPRQQALGEVL